MMNRKLLPYPLKVTVSQNGNFIFELTFTEYPIIIGRSSKCDIPLSQFDFLSRQHCEITADENNVIEIFDLGSSNGIFVEGQRVKKAVIRGYAQIEIGEILLSIELDSPLAEPPTVAQAKFNDEVTAPPKKLKLPPACPVVDAAKTYQLDIEKEMGKKLGSQKNIRIPFGPGPAKGKEAPRMVHFGGEHRLLDVKLDNELMPKEQEPSISKVEQNPIHKNVVTKKPELPKHPDKKPITRYVQASQLKPQNRILETYVTWKDQIYDHGQFYAGDKIVVGTGKFSNVKVPVLTKDFKFAFFDGMNTQVFVPQNLKFEIEGESKNYSPSEAPKSPGVTKSKNHYLLKLGAGDLLTVKITDDISVHLRYAPAPREFSTEFNFIKDQDMKITGAIVLTVAIFIFAFIFLLKTREVTPPLVTTLSPPEQQIVQQPVPQPILQIKPIEPIRQLATRAVAQTPKPVVTSKPTNPKPAKKKYNKHR
jgi:hypothetical protein